VSTPAPLLASFGHHKCATQWITAMLADFCEVTHLRMFKVSRAEDWDFADLRALVGCFRPDVLVYSNAEIRQVKTLGRLRGFHVVRDPRDLIVSAYYSHLHSHSLETWPGLAEHRRRLQATDKSAGLLLEMDFSRRVLLDMGDWDYAQPDVLELRMEDLIASPAVHVSRIVEHLGLTHLPPSTYGERLGGLAGILLARLQRLMRRHLQRVVAPLSPEPEETDARAATRAGGPDPYFYYPLDIAWRRGFRPRSLAIEDVPVIVKRHSFENKAGGRDRGVEDAHNHYRKGLAGDWRNHFEPVHIDHFKRNYNDVLLALRYETDPHWG
jgi:hypothetical protein